MQLERLHASVQQQLPWRPGAPDCAMAPVWQDQICVTARHCLHRKNHQK